MPDMQRVHNTKVSKNVRRYERSRHKRVTSMVSTYTNELRNVMEKMPANRLVPPIRGAGAALALSNKKK